jgi:hypothetical protein
VVVRERWLAKISSVSTFSEEASLNQEEKHSNMIMKIFDICVSLSYQCNKKSTVLTATSRIIHHTNIYDALQSTVFLQIIQANGQANGSIAKYSATPTDGFDRST